MRLVLEPTGPNHEFFRITDIASGKYKLTQGQSVRVPKSGLPYDDPNAPVALGGQLAVGRKLPSLTSVMAFVNAMQETVEHEVHAAEFGPLFMHGMELKGVLVPVFASARRPWSRSRTSSADTPSVKDTAGKVTVQDLDTACTPLSPAQERHVRGKIAFVRRGECLFAVKAEWLQLAGAVGMVVASESPNPLIMSPLDVGIATGPGRRDGVDTIQIPAVLAVQDVADEMLQTLSAKMQAQQGLRDVVKSFLSAVGEQMRTTLASIEAKYSGVISGLGQLANLGAGNSGGNGHDGQPGGQTGSAVAPPSLDISISVRDTELELAEKVSILQLTVSGKPVSNLKIVERKVPVLVTRAEHEKEMARHWFRRVGYRRSGMLDHGSSLGCLAQCPASTRNGCCGRI
ncbi:hypothetical protein BC831DRAFT_305629 [Entophlyctis helioformis]|nr:hypothetical protein BC831DRAFT_305629 [Entophlyctis helioformis]